MGYLKFYFKNNLSFLNEYEWDYLRYIKFYLNNKEL